MPSQYKVLIFDLQGTTTDFYTPLHKKITSYFPRIDADMFIKSWRTLYFSTMKTPHNHAMPSSEVYKRCLDSILKQKNLSIGSQAEEELINSWITLDPWPDTIPGLNRLREKYILTTLSNAEISSIVSISRSAKITWDAIFSASTIGAFKPDPQTYTSVLRAFAIPAHQALMIASHTYDLIGASHCGIHTAYVNRPFEFGSDTQPEKTNHNTAFDFYVNSFVELADMLDC